MTTKAKGELSQQVGVANMSDVIDCKIILFAEEHAGFICDIEEQAEYFAAVAGFERNADERRAFIAKYGRSAANVEAADLEAL